MINYRMILSILVFFFSAVNNYGAGDEADELLYSVAKVMVIVTLLSILLVLWLVLIYSEKNDNQGELIKTPARKFLNMLTKTTPVEKEHELLLDHDYDGIKELDSRIPPWFHGLLWLTIVFGIVYMIQYHVIGSGDVQAEEWLAEMEEAAIERTILLATGALLNEETVTFTSDIAALNEGSQIFKKNCAACHGNGGEGLVGPNLTDEYWVHGGGIKNIFKIVKYGVPQKGMISWQTQLDPNQMQAVSSYIVTLAGTNPPNQKGPEGKKYDPATDPDAIAAANPALASKGIGPIQSLTISEVDYNLAKLGEDLYRLKCSSCHKIEKRFVGPALKGVTQRRSPEWIMNMMLNPDEMVKKDEIARELLMEYISPMANQSLTEDEARAILEFLRTQEEKEEV